jgi:hypothetical protein
LAGQAAFRDLIWMTQEQLLYSGDLHCGRKAHTSGQTGRRIVGTVSPDS